MNNSLRNVLKSITFGLLALFAIFLFAETETPPAGSLDRLIRSLEQTDDPQVQAALMQGMLKGMEGRRNIPEPTGWKALAARLTSSDDVEVRQRALQISQIFGDEMAVRQALDLLKDRSADAGRRRAALDRLLDQQNVEASEALETLVDDPALTLDVIRGFATVENPKAPDILLTRFADMDVAERRAALETLSSRKVYARALLEAVREGKITRQEIPAQVSRTLHLVLGQAWIEVYGDTQQPIAAEREKLLAKYRQICNAEALQNASPNRGRVVYEKTCAACHLLYGQGGKVGPDLTGSNRRDLEYLLLNSVDPSFDVAEGYRTLIIQTVDGRLLTGVLDEEDETRVVLRTADQPRVVIAKADIEGRRLSRKSVMPEGQLDQLTEQEVVDLVKYLGTSEQVGLKAEQQTNELPQRQHKISQAPFLNPEQAVDKMSIPAGFDISVFASEPDIAEPIAFCFDHRGRLWVAENFNYQTRRQHTDDPVSRIQILEDTDGDGVFDKKKTFTDTLTFTSGIACGMGGVFVGSPPHLTFIPDQNDDDIPDGPPQVLLDGWGIQDRHETLNSFLWGPDGWLYGCHGVFTMSNVGKPGDPESDRQFIDGGIWRYHPTRQTFEVFARGLSNPWGFDFDDHGQGFATCCVIPHLFHIVQGGVYHKQSKPHVNPHIYDYIPTIRDHTHLSAHGGARFYLADAFPPEYHDRLFMCNIHEHAVLTDRMVRKGSSFIGQHGDDFLPTNDMAWVGFSVEIGPEGGVYILDWHDQDVCGNSVQFPDSGRVYRILPTDAPKVESINLRRLTDLQLVEMQTHRNDWWVRQARTELQHRAHTGKLDRSTVHAALQKQLTDGVDAGRQLRALWALHVTDGADEPFLSRLLGHPDEYVRAWAIQLLGDQSQVNAFQPERTPPEEKLVHSAPVRKKFAELAHADPSPVVRLYLASAVQRMPFDHRWPILAGLLQHAEDAEDNNLYRMYWFAMEPMVSQYPERSLEWVAQGAIPVLNEFVARRLIAGDQNLAEVAKVETARVQNLTLQKIAPGFQVRSVGELGVVHHPEFRNRKAVQTHPLERNIPCQLKRRIKIPQDQTTSLKLRVSHHPHGDWQLRVLANRELMFDQIVGPQTVGDDQWLDVEVDLTPFAGKTISLVIENRANDWRNEWAYWNQVKIVSE
ncbi:MAG: c-type cytochrome [Mariniblastus sp.]|nr:c-type cytochrome [Mariniblastus sp.]